ncbi:MAG: DUF1036 domain-containing protein [Pseudomonadota bacterium]
MVPEQSSTSQYLATFALAIWAILAFAAPNALAQDEERGWQVCNETSFIIEAATGRFEGQSVVVDGWTRLRPGACDYAIKGDLTPGLHYLFGRSSNAHRSGQRIWGGDFPLCIDPTGSFSVENLQNCTSMGLEARSFRPVMIENRTRWRTSFTETAKRDLDQAAAAGVQRLLDDAGVFSGQIDGFLGRRTRAAIADFLTSKNLSRETTDADLVDILEQAARERARNIGLTFCNRTDKRIWSAMAQRDGDGWESRGWWLLDAGGCARVIDEPLLQSQYFVYAELETGDGGVRTLARGSDPFCVSRSKFAITGRDACEAAAFRTGRFVSTPPPKDRKLVFEFFERDFGQQVSDR